MLASPTQLTFTPSWSFQKFTHTLYNNDTNSARAYASSTTMCNYHDMLSEWVNKMMQLKITAFFRAHHQQEEEQQKQQQEERPGVSNNSIPSDANVNDVMLMFSGFREEEEKEPQPSTAVLHPSSQ